MVAPEDRAGDLAGPDHLYALGPSASVAAGLEADAARRALDDRSSPA